MTFSVIFAVNAVAMMMGNLASTKLDNPHKTLKYSIIGVFFFSLITSATLLLNANIYLFYCSMFILLFFVVAIFPVTANLVLDLEQKFRGTASAVLGATGFLAGGLVMPLVGVGNILYSTACVMTVCAAMALITMLWGKKSEINGVGG